MEGVAEFNAVRYDLASWQTFSPRLCKMRDELTRELYILLINQNLVSIRSKLVFAETRNGLACFGQSSELVTIKTDGIIEHSRAIDDGDRLVLAEQDLVCGKSDQEVLSDGCWILTGSKIAVRTTGLELLPPVSRRQIWDGDPHLRHVLLVQSMRFQYAHDVLAHRQGSHPIYFRQNVRS